MKPEQNNMNTPTPRTDELANRLIPIAENITATTAQTIITQVVADILTLTTELETELTAARKELYRSASLSDVERRVDECIELREKLMEERDKWKSGMGKPIPADLAAFCG